MGTQTGDLLECLAAIEIKYLDCSTEPICLCLSLPRVSCRPTELRRRLEVPVNQPNPSAKPASQQPPPPATAAKAQVAICPSIVLCVTLSAKHTSTRTESANRVDGWNYIIWRDYVGSIESSRLFGVCCHGRGSSGQVGMR